MYLLFEERRVFVRSMTHTVVFEWEPEFERFATDPSGRVDRFVRVWLAEGHGQTAHAVTYLGGVRVLDSERPFSRRELRALQDRLNDAAGSETAALTRSLARHLRRFAMDCA